MEEARRKHRVPPSGRGRGAAMLVKTLRNFASQLLSMAVSLGDRFVLAAILLRVWSTDLFADWATLTACASMLGLADLGLVLFFGNRLQRAFSLGDAAGFQRIVGTAAFVYPALALVILTVAGALAALEASVPFLSIRALEVPEAARVLLLLGVIQSLHTAKSAFTQIYRGRGDYARGVIIDAISGLCIVASALLAASQGVGAPALASVYIVAHLIFGWGVLITDLRRRYPELRLLPIRPNAAELRDAGLSMRWYSLSYMLPSIWMQAPVLLLSALGLGGATVVSLVIHRTLVNFGRNFAVMLSVSAGVELAPHVHSADAVAIERGMSIIGRSVAAIGGTLAAGLLIFGAPMIGLWTGKSDLADAATLFWLVAPAVAVAPAIPLLYLAHLSDLPKPQALAQVAQTGVAIALALPLAKSHGAAGVAFAMAAGEVLGVGLLLPMLLTKRLHIAYQRHAILCLAIALATTAWGGAAGKAVEALIGTQGLERLFLGLALWSVLTLAPIGYMLLPAGRRERLLRLVRTEVHI